MYGKMLRSFVFDFILKGLIFDIILFEDCFQVSSQLVFWFRRRHRVQICAVICPNWLGWTDVTFSHVTIIR